MPKHISLAMAVRHLSGSAQLIGLLNGFGYSVSHSFVLEHDTALAQQEIERGSTALPSCIHSGLYTTLVWDNNDFGEETLSGKGTTHNTNGIAIQHTESQSQLVFDYIYSCRPFNWENKLFFRGSETNFVILPVATI